ncbi:hypothetical protein HME9302_00302 [Alteripontixanthobacter maritimus]|uniref:Alginate lyase domain-containing protein n=1 Tax=Alteripontixanthobacter maritimus TaxID=2161824 RepID=A0A369Q747_9SPHN|nr:alginate lyase family protein [Alteripontixanthobacter maritimus]RDC59117.1 hypothetical protein HME9302_00302 [Alteripontixanthobacter maritimus]
MAGGLLRAFGIACLIAGSNFGLGAASAQDAPSPAPAPSPSPSPQCRGSAGYAADFDGRRTFLWRPDWLHGIKAAAAADPEIAKGIRSAAESALASGPYSVTDKTKLPPGASANDYVSIGPYWWPDPKKKDGLPYIRKDGEVNPERDGPEFDKDRLRNLANAVRDLAVGHYVTGEERYARHAALLLRTWFITPATRMNPSFAFAQGIPGKVAGRGEGIIEASHLSTIVEAAGLLEPTDVLSPDEHNALRAWYRDFVVWMATSENGEDEMRKANNHGLFYDFYLAHFALFAGAENAAENVAKAFPEYRLGRQMDRQGRFIAELKRTRSWHYSVYAVEAAARLATIAECVGLDLWTTRLEDGRGLDTARQFLARYAADPASWPFPDSDLDRGRIERMRAEYAELAALFPDAAQDMTLAALP